MPHDPALAGTPAPEPIPYAHYDVNALPVREQLLAWRDRMGQITDVVPLHAQVGAPFRASIDRWEAGGIMFADCYTDLIKLDRSIARISQDNARRICFNVFIDGDAQSVIERPAKRGDAEAKVGVLAIDLDQPVRLIRRGSRHFSIFTPGALIQSWFADPPALHGRRLEPHDPAARVVVERVLWLRANIREMAAEAAQQHLRELVELIAAAFAAQAGLSGGKRALARAATYASAREFVRANLANVDLTPEFVLDRLALSRPSVYRLFQHEGGLNAYIRHVRLRAAAHDLVRYPGVAIKDIAYSVGFRSATDFTRAFRRDYDVAPQDVRFYKGVPAGR